MKVTIFNGTEDYEFNTIEEAEEILEGEINYKINAPFGTIMETDQGELILVEEDTSKDELENYIVSIWSKEHEAIGYLCKLPKRHKPGLALYEWKKQYADDFGERYEPEWRIVSAATTYDKEIYELMWDAGDRIIDGFMVIEPYEE